MSTSKVADDGELDEERTVGDADGATTRSGGADGASTRSGGADSRAQVNHKQTPDSLCVDATTSRLPTPSSDPGTIHSATMLSSRVNSYDDLTVTERPVYSQTGFDAGHHNTELEQKTIRDRRDALVHTCCHLEGVKRRIHSFLPFIAIMRSYKLNPDLVSDLIAGTVVGIINIPQGMAYGLLTNLPPVYGLYVSFFPVLIYFFLGTSRHMAMGTFAVVSLMVAGVIDRYNCDDLQFAGNVPSVMKYNDTSTQIMTEFTVESDGSNGTSVPSHIDVIVSDEVVQCKLNIAVTITFVAGLLQIAMGMLQLGFVNNYLSEPLTRGFTTGTAIHVFTSQVKHIIGIKTAQYTGAGKLIKIYAELFSNLGSINWVSVSISLTSIAILVLIKELINPRVKKKLKVPVPGELVVVVVATLAVKFCSLNENHAVRIVGPVPTGIPPPKLPDFSEMGNVFTDAISVSIVGFAISMSLVNLFASKNNYKVDPNQELLAYGFSNTISSFFNCFMAAGSMSRTIIQESVGGHTQVASLVNCAIILVVMFLIGPLFQQTPNCALAAIIVVALKNMFLQVTDLKKLWLVSKFDFAIWLVAFLSTVFIDVDIGLLIAIAFSLLTVVFRTQRPYTCILGRVPGTDIYRNIKVYTHIQQFEGVRIFRFESSLYYANCEHFIHKLYKKTGVDPRKVQWKHEQDVKKQQKANLRKRKKENAELSMEEASEVTSLPLCDISHVIIDCTTMAYIDWVGVNTLSKVIAEYGGVGVYVMLAGCKARVRHMLEVAGFYKKIDKDCLYVTLHDAVVSALTSNPQLQEQKGAPWNGPTLINVIIPNNSHHNAVLPPGDVPLHRTPSSVRSVQPPCKLSLLRTPSGSRSETTAPPSEISLNTPSPGDGHNAEPHQDTAASPGDNTPHVAPPSDNRLHVAPSTGNNNALTLATSSDTNVNNTPHDDAAKTSEA